MTAQPCTADDTATILEEVRTEISHNLRDLTAESELVELLIATRQRRLGFLTAEGRAAIAVQVAQDQRAQAVRRRNLEPLGLAWMRTETDKGPGVTAAPGAVDVISVQAATIRRLHQLVEYLTTALFAQGVCTLHQLLTEAPIQDVTTHLRALAMDLDDHDALTDVLESLEKLVEDLRDVIDGNDRTHLPAPCPHCGRDSLIVFWRDKITRCDKSPKSRHYAPCTCPDPLCECKHRPVAYRHTWNLDRPPSAANSWQTLASRLNHNRSITAPKEPTP